MMKTIFFKWPLLFLIFMVSCTYEFPLVEKPTKDDLGSLNVEKVIAAGDDYLSGLMDGALYSDGQKRSVGSIIAEQLNNIQDIQFMQPSIDADNGYNLYASTENEIFGRWIYQFLDNYEETPERILTLGESIQNYKGDKNLLNDLTVPQLHVNQLSDIELFKNPFFTRIAADENLVYVEQVIQRSPTFLLLWTGMNDYLDFAVNGAIEPEKLTSVENFEASFQYFIEEIIQKTNSKIVIGNLISIHDLPFFYTNQYNFIRLTNAKKSAAQAKYSSYNAAVFAYNVGRPVDEIRPAISFNDNGATLYPQPVVVIDENLPNAIYPDGSPLEKYRQLTEGEMALLTITSEMVDNGMGSIKPLSQKFYLSANQIDQIEQSIASFNRIIQELSARHPERIIVSDIKTEVRIIAETAKMDAWGIPVSTDLIYVGGVPLEGGLGQNSIFSLDALHFNQRGNAFISNLFINSLNLGFQAKIPIVDINNYIGNVYTFSH